MASAGRPPSLLQSPMSPAPTTTTVGNGPGVVSVGGGGVGVAGFGEPVHAAATTARSQIWRSEEVLTCIVNYRPFPMYIAAPFPVQFVQPDTALAEMPAPKLPHGYQLVLFFAELLMIGAARTPVTLRARHPFRRGCPDLVGDRHRMPEIAGAGVRTSLRWRISTPHMAGARCVGAEPAVHRRIGIGDARGAVVSWDHATRA